MLIRLTMLMLGGCLGFLVACSKQESEELLTELPAVQETIVPLAVVSESSIPAPIVTLQDEVKVEVMEVAPVVVQAEPIDPNQLFSAIEADDRDQLAKYLEQGLPVDFVAENGDTPLCYAIRLKRLELAMLLIASGANVNLPGLDAQLPLALASFYRHPNLIATLLKKGADPNIVFTTPMSEDLIALAPDAWLRSLLKRETGVTPLMACSIRGDVEGVLALIQAGAKTNAHTRPNYRYAINVAADRGYLFIMRVLLGRDPDAEPTRLIKVSLSKQSMQVIDQGEVILTSKVSSGKAGKETPVGRYIITNKHKDWTSTIYKVPMPYFMRFNCSEIGFHSGRVTGRPASSGCIRLPPAIAVKMFKMSKIGDEVVVED